MIFGEFSNITSRYLSQVPWRNHAVSCLYFKAKKFLTLCKWINFYMHFKFGFLILLHGLSQSHFRSLSAKCSIMQRIWYTLLFKNNYLITKSEVITGKYQSEALLYSPSDSKVNMVGQGLRFSRNDRTVEVIKLSIIWHQQVNYLLLCLCKPVIGLWALRENNTLQFSHN